MAAGGNAANSNGNGAGGGQSQQAHADAPGQVKQAGQPPATGQPDVGTTVTTASPAAGPTLPAPTTGSVGGGQPSGDVTGPQPVSHADANAGGANGQCPGGPYCSTRDGSASGNGNGGGQAVGRPCAGCVGRADNKNPQGQKPGAQDRNNGYECDGNRGIARTNPAHTGCSTPPPPPPPCVDKPNKPCSPPPVCVDKPGKPCSPPPVCVPSAANNNCQPGQPSRQPICVPSTSNNQCLPAPECQPKANEDVNCVAVQGVKTSRTPATDPPRDRIGVPDERPEARVLPAKVGALADTGAVAVPVMLGLGGSALALGLLLVLAGRRSRRS